MRYPASRHIELSRRSGGRLPAKTGRSLHLNSFGFAVICVQFDERGGKCSFRNLKPTQDIPMVILTEALEAYGRALEMSQLEQEKRFLQRRIQEVKK